VLCPEAQVEWTELQYLLLGVHLTTELDVIRWGLTTSGKFTTNSLYNFMTSSGVDSKTTERIWKCRLPLKIKIFLWQVGRSFRTEF
jgi:hypothetical protein